MIQLDVKAHSDLKCIDALHEFQNTIIISAIEGLMSSIMCEEWVQLIASKDLNSVDKYERLYCLFVSAIFFH